MMANNESQTPRQIIKSFEAKALKKRPIYIKAADELTTYFGSLSFLLLNAVVFSGWIIVNLGYLRPVIEPFDQFPFILLTMVVSLEAIFLTIIVLLSQNRQSVINSLREELHMQVNLIAERELTKALQLISDIHSHLKITRRDDPELDAMLKQLNTSYIEHRLEDQMKGEQKTIKDVVTGPFSKFTQAVNKTIQVAQGNGNHEKNNVGAIHVGSAKA